MLAKTQIEIFDGRSAGLFSQEPFEKRPAMNIEELVKMQIEILDTQSWGLFSFEPYEKDFKWAIWKQTWTLTVEDFVLHSDNHFESRLESSLL